MQILTPALVPVAKALLLQQGADPNIIDNNGNLSAVGAIGLFFNEAEVRTSLTPAIRFPITASGPPPSPAVQELLNQLQPSVVLTGPAGTATVAPYGVPVGASSWVPVALIGVGVVAFLGWAIWGD